MALYFIYFAGGGLFVTYLPLHFAAIGLSAKAIGAIYGLRTVLTTLLQPWISTAAERSGRPLVAIALVSTLGHALSWAQPFGTVFWAVAVPIWLAAPGFASVVPLTDASVVRSYGIEAYGRFRVWGSLGFGVVVVAFGLGVRRMTPDEAGMLSAWVYVALTAVGALVAWIAAWGERPDPRDAGRAFSWPGPGFLGLLVASSLHWGAINIFNVFLALHTAELGLGVWVPGAALGVAIAAEVAGFVWARRFLVYDARRVFVAVCLSGVVRWAIVASVHTELAITLVQVIHVLSFGAWYAVVMNVLGHWGGDARRGAVQGLFAALCFGVGGTVASLAGGAVHDAFGGEGTFWFAAVLDGLAAVAYLAGRTPVPTMPPVVVAPTVARMRA